MEKKQYVLPSVMRDLLDRYGGRVSAGEYTKIPYGFWKSLYNFCMLHSDKDEGWVRVYLKDGVIRVLFPGFTYECPASKDFGAFLMKQFGWESSTSYLFEDGAVVATSNLIKNTNTINDKENKTMKFNFDFGPVSPFVRMSMYGMAVKNKTGTWVSYDAKSGEIVDVDVFNFDGAKFLYRMPVAIKDIAIGDVVIHNGAPMFVVAIPNDGKALTVVDVISGERKDIMLAKSPFGFNFVTKVVNFLNGAFNGTATEDNPFGNMWMLMAMSGDNADMNDILPFLMMNNANSGMDNNMLMCLMLSKNKANADMLPWLLMSQSMNATPAHTCKCGGNCGEAHNKE